MLPHKQSFACAALRVVLGLAFIAMSGCQGLTTLRDRLFYDRLTVVNPLVESPTYLPSLRIVRPSEGMVSGFDGCKFSIGTIDPNFDYWLIEWPDVIYLETVMKDGRPVEQETPGHEICLTKVTHASTTAIDAEPDKSFSRIWEIDFESDTGATGPVMVRRHNARLLNLCNWKGQKLALWRYDDRVCLPNRNTVTDSTRQFMFRARKAGTMLPVHGWEFVSLAEKHRADPRPTGAFPNFPSSAGQDRARKPVSAPARETAPATSPADSAPATTPAAPGK